MSSVYLVEDSFQPRMRTSQSSHHSGGPIEILPFTVSAPVRRRGCQDVSQITDLVGQLNQLGLMRNVRRMAHLLFLTNRFVQVFVVGHLQLNPCYLVAKNGSQFLGCGFGVLNGVVQQCSANHVRIFDTALDGQHTGQ